MKRTDYYYKPKGKFKVPGAIAELARRRIGGLLDFSEFAHRRTIDVLANAYLLGIKDACEAMEEKEIDNDLDA